MKPLMTVILSMAISALAFAHHPFESEFDSKAPVTLTGTITKVDWLDPHVILHADVKDASGQTRNWDLEAGSPAEMKKNGWAETTLKQGDTIVVQGYRAKSGSYRAAARVVKLPNGKELPAMSDDGGPKK